LRTQINQKNSKNVNTNQTQNKWAIFTYHSPIIRKITNLFKQTDIKLAFRNTNTIRQTIRPKLKDNTQGHDKSGIYKLICKTCNKENIGQTSRNLTLTYKEHIRYIKNNDPQSAYALHILQNRHEYGPLEDIMTLIKPIRNANLLIPYEQLLIQTTHKEGNLISEQKHGEHNPLFALITEYNYRHT